MDRDSGTESDKPDESLDPVATPTAAAKKRKNKKKKKKQVAKPPVESDNGPEIVLLKISRAKHWKYISSYHGQWLQLPNEIVDTLFAINCNTAPIYQRFDDFLPRTFSESMGLLPMRCKDRRKEDLPPPIDKAAFLGVSSVRKLIEQASDLALRAASGLSSAAFGAFGDNPPPYGDEDPLMNLLRGKPNGGGRSQNMSATRQLRLRVMAVAKLAQAYKIDEIAASVAIMQGSTALDDVAERVLKQEPFNPDARYVHFFHEKIPSRTLAQSTTTAVLEQLIAQYPDQLHYYRTCGIVHAARHEFAEAIAKYTQALSLAKAIRKVKDQAKQRKTLGGSNKKSKRRQNQQQQQNHNPQVNSDDDDDAASGVAAIEEAANLGDEPGDDIERQILFLRGTTYYSWALNILERMTSHTESVRPESDVMNEGGEATLDGIGLKAFKSENTGLLTSQSRKEAYAAVFGHTDVRNQVNNLLQRSLRDHERFLSYFPLSTPPKGTTLDREKRSVAAAYRQKPTLIPSSNDKPYEALTDFEKDVRDEFKEAKTMSPHMKRILAHRSLDGRTRYTNPNNVLQDDEPTLLTTYHPLLTESLFSVLLISLLLGDFTTTLRKHYTTSSIMSSLEGFPIFLPARSMNQAQYSETLERIATTWMVERELSGNQAPTAEEGEEQLARTGPLPCLHHIASFFSPQYDAMLETFWTNAAKHPKTTQKTPLHIANEAHKDAPTEPRAPLSARAEIISAYVQTVCIPSLDPAKLAIVAAEGNSSQAVL